MRRVLFVMFAAIVACAGFACERRQAAAPTARSTTQTHRVVVLSPALAVIVRDLGYEAQVVARHAYDDVLPRELPAVGDQAGIDYEALLRVRPTHVLVQWGARELPERLTQLATEHQWQITNANPLTLAQIKTAVRDIDAALGSAKQLSPGATQLLDQLSQFDATPQSSWGPVLLLASTSPPAALGPGSCHAELLAAVGGVPAISEGSPWMELSNEDLVRMQPRAIVLIRPRSARGVTDADAPTRDPWQPLADLGLSAVRTGHVAIIDDPEGLLPSTSMIRVGEALRQHVRAWSNASER
ncbi:MAG TPA: hypothetical protein VK157_03510 [Phycisphaerales bacterium]|nr:hypothetical protein [Phycisphaerales bacterium]